MSDRLFPYGFTGAGLAMKDVSGRIITEQDSNQWIHTHYRTI